MIKLKAPESSGKTNNGLDYLYTVERFDGSSIGKFGGTEEQRILYVGGEEFEDKELLNPGKNFIFQEEEFFVES